MRLYAIQVDIYEPSSGDAYPIVQHRFLGRDRNEAAGYHESHRKSDAFLRQCEDKGLFADRVRCRAVITEGWLA